MPEKELPRRRAQAASVWLPTVVWLRTSTTVRAIEVVTMEAQPRVLKYEGEKVHDILHAWGTNGIITRLCPALAPAVYIGHSARSPLTPSMQHSPLHETHRKVQRKWTSALITVFEWLTLSFFAPVKQFSSPRQGADLLA